MAKIHVAFPAGKQLKLEESELIEEWEEGRIPPDSLYWQPGMSEWEPISDYLSEKGVSQARAPRLKHRYRRDPKPLTSFLETMLWIYLAVVITLLATRLVTPSSSTISFESDSPEDAIAQMRVASEGLFDTAAFMNLREFIVYSLYIGIGLVTWITFFKWCYRINNNCHGFGAKGLVYSPGWSVGCFFIPIASLVWPYQMMDEVWKASTDPQHWRRKEGNFLVGLWWGFWIAALLCSVIGSRMTDRSMQPQTQRFGNFLFIIELFFSLANSYITIALIRSITAKQQQLVRGR